MTKDEIIRAITALTQLTFNDGLSVKMKLIIENKLLTLIELL